MKTVKSINKENSSKFVLTNGSVFVAPCKDLQVQLTDKKEEAETWTYADTLSVMKLSFHRSITGLNLSFVQA